MKKNRSFGYTMIEILATILILLVIMLLATPSIRRMLSKTNELSQEFIENAVLDAAKEYAIVNNKAITSNLKVVGDTSVISLITLLNIGLIEQEDIDKLGLDARVLITLKENNGLEFSLVYDNSLVENTNSHLLLLGNNPIYITKGLTFLDPGYIAYDKNGKSIVDKVEVTGIVDTNTIGLYEISYKLTDELENVEEKTRTVVVLDMTYPNVVSATVTTNNQNNKYAKNGDTVILNVVFNKEVTNPTVTIGGKKATVTGNSTNKYASYTINAYEKFLNEGNLNIKISNYIDEYDNIGPIVTNLTNGDLIVYDRTPPIINDTFSGKTLFNDPTFLSGNNSMIVYNNSANGTVSHSRISTTTPYGNYAIRITTNGVSSPGLGGYYQLTQSIANGIFIHKITAKIPVGYTIEWAANALGDNPAVEWLTPKNGTGEYEDYMYVLRTSSTGSFSSFGFVYLSGPGTSVTWDVAYSTIIDAGTNLFLDSNFSSGTNGMQVYNNLGNGTVVHNRIENPNKYGNYTMKITTNGSSTPGLGGYVQVVNSRANALYIHKIIANIPVGYTIERASNALGDNPAVYWVTPQNGTGKYEEYIYITKTSGTGSFSTFGHVYLIGPGTSVTWYVAYSTIIDAGTQSINAAVSFKATDNLSGYNSYSILKGDSSIPISYQEVDKTNNYGIYKGEIISNGQYYVWVKDMAGNLTMRTIPVANLGSTQYRKKVCTEFNTCVNSACSCASYSTCSHADCGYNTCSNAACGCASYYSCANAACGCGGYNSCQNEACGGYWNYIGTCYCKDPVVANYGCSYQITSSGGCSSFCKKVGTYYSGSCYRSMVYYSCPNAACGCAYYATCPTSGCGCSAYNSCATSGCGTKTCQTAACGCSSYNSCANSGCGCKTWGEFGEWTLQVCTNVDNEVICEIRTIE